MTNLIGPVPPLVGDILTTTNNGQGLNTFLANVQDGNGINSSMQIATTAVNFSRINGNTFQLDADVLTASVAALNALSDGTAPSNFSVTNNLIVGRNLVVDGGIIYSRTAVGVTPYDVLITDYIVAVTVNAAGVHIVLPAPSMGNIGQTFIIQDEVGNALANHINISVAGGALINGAASVNISVNYSGLTLYSNGANYFVVSGTPA